MLAVAYTSMKIKSVEQALTNIELTVAYTLPELRATLKKTTLELELCMNQSIYRGIEQSIVHSESIRSGTDSDSQSQAYMCKQVSRTPAEFRNGRTSEARSPDVVFHD